MSGIFIVYILLLIASIALYCMFAIGLYTMARRKNLSHAWLSWLPIAQFYILGEIINKKVYLGKEIGNAQILLPVLALVINLLQNVQNGYFAIIYLFILLFTIIYFMAAYFRLFKLYDKRNAILYLVISIISLGLGSLIFVFILRNKEPIEYLP